MPKTIFAKFKVVTPFHSWSVNPLTSGSSVFKNQLSKDIPLPLSGPTMLERINVLFLLDISPTIFVFPYTSVASVIDVSMYPPSNPENTQSVPI